MSGIAPVVTRKKMSEPDDDLSFWRSRPVADRVEALSEMRGDFEGGPM
jgi:hypothetical protein